MPNTPDPEERAERLRVLIDCAPYLLLSAGEENPDVATEDVEILGRIAQEDLHLVNACLEVEAELRQVQFAAVEELTALVAAGEGHLDERILALPEPELYDAFAAIIACMWVDQ